MQPPHVLISWYILHFYTSFKNIMLLLEIVGRVMLKIYIANKEHDLLTSVNKSSQISLKLKMIKSKMFVVCLYGTGGKIRTPLRGH